MEDTLLKDGKTYVWLTTSFIAWHKWEGAPDVCSHLKNYHRHKFNVKMWFEVSHDDRDVEFQKQKQHVDEYIANKYNYKPLANMSCEMIARELGTDFFADMVSVDEDGENGAVVIFPSASK